ncbi:MAG: Queuine tRNA-ribosyltransferase, partial [uncultured bacterium]
LLNARWQLSDQPIDEGCSCYACRTFSRGYLRHLFKAREILGLRMASLHNVTFMVNLMNEIRQALLAGRFLEFRDRFLANYLSKEI